jgi:hypothetical protein
LKKTLDNVKCIPLDSFKNPLFQAMKLNLNHPDIDEIIKEMDTLVDQEITYKKNALLMQNQVYSSF